MAVTMFIAIIPKIAILAFFVTIGNLGNHFPIIGMIGACSLLSGAVGLGGQWRIRRIIAYSAISHTGFIIISPTGSVFAFYVLLYALTSLML